MHRFDNSHLAGRAMLMDPTRAAQVRLQQYQQQVSPTQSAATISSGSDDGSEMKVYDKNGLRINAIQALKHSEDIEDGEIYAMVETIREMRRDPYLKKKKGKVSVRLMNGDNRIFSVSIDSGADISTVKPRTIVDMNVKIKPPTKITHLTIAEPNHKVKRIGTIDLILDVEFHSGRRHQS